MSCLGSNIFWLSMKEMMQRCGCYVIRISFFFFPIASLPPKSATSMAPRLHPLFLCLSVCRPPPPPPPPPPSLSLCLSFSLSYSLSYSLSFTLSLLLSLLLSLSYSFSLLLSLLLSLSYSLCVCRRFAPNVIFIYALWFLPNPYKSFTIYLYICLSLHVSDCLSIICFSFFQSFTYPL